jgi:hypothetical protein
MTRKMMIIGFCLALAAGLLGALAAPRVLAATCHWTGAISADWAVAGNWGCGQVPGSDDTALVGPATHSPVVTANATVGTVVVTGGGVLTYSAGTGVTFTIGSFSIDDGGTYIHNRASVTPLTAANRAFAPGSTVEIQSLGTPGGAMPAFGHLIVANNGTIQFSGYLAAVAGNLTKRGSGELRLATAQLVNLAIGGDVSLEAGTITVQSSVTTNAATVTVGGDVMIGSGATLQRGAGAGLWTLSLAGDWINDGAFSPGNSHVVFNGSGVDKYRGVDIQTADDLGSTTVAVSGNQSSCPNVLGFPARRCYAINPANPGAAGVTFHLTPAELQTGQSPNTLKVWRWTGTGTLWTELTKSGSDSTCTTASNCYVAATGVTSFGEFVLQNDDPTSVTLVEFFAQQTDSHIRVTWETASELGNVGFNLYRGVSQSEPDRRLNDLLIPSQSLGNPSAGFTYTWDDDADLVPGTTYYYWLEDVDVNNVATRHGPVSVDFTVPTAVTLNGVHASPAAGAAALPWLWVVAGAGAALALGRRRQR